MYIINNRVKVSSTGQFFVMSTSPYKACNTSESRLTRFNYRACHYYNIVARDLSFRMNIIVSPDDNGPTALHFT